MLLLIGLFTGPFRSFFIYGTIIVFLLTSVFGYVKLKEHEAAKEALLQFNQAQLEQTIKENKIYADHEKALQEQVDQLSKQNTELNNLLQLKSDQVEAWINNQKDTTLDPIFNDVLKQMRGTLP
jgi:predicted nuclease with TOPRIM domain